MKCTVMIWGSWVRTLVGSKLGCVVLLSMSYFNQKYTFHVHETPFLTIQLSGTAYNNVRRIALEVGGDFKCTGSHLD